MTHPLVINLRDRNVEVCYHLNATGPYDQSVEWYIDDLDLNETTVELTAEEIKSIEDACLEHAYDRSLEIQW